MLSQLQQAQPHPLPLTSRRASAAPLGHRSALTIFNASIGGQSYVQVWAAFMLGEEVNRIKVAEGIDTDASEAIEEAIKNAKSEGVPVFHVPPIRSYSSAPNIRERVMRKLRNNALLLEPTPPLCLRNLALLPHDVLLGRYGMPVYGYKDGELFQGDLWVAGISGEVMKLTVVSPDRPAIKAHSDDRSILIYPVKEQGPE